MRRLFLALTLVFSLVIQAQNSVSVADYYRAKVDSLLMQMSSRGDIETDSVRENPAYYKMMVPPVLYNSTMERGMREGFDMHKENVSTMLDMDNDRNVLIDKMLLNVYKNHPSLIECTEGQLRDVKTVKKDETLNIPVDIKVAADAPASLPQDITESVATEYVKPNYWRTSGEFSMNFTQNYVSGNWHAGGENNKTMLALLKLVVKYDDKDKITFENVFDARLGFTTVRSDTMHSLKTNNDMLRLESKLGYKVAKNLSATIKLQMQTQSMPSYPTNSRDFVSNFMAPFDANFSIGIDYKLSGKNWAMSLYFAPLSSYNYKFVRYQRLASRFGIREGRQHKEDFGTQVVFKPNATILPNLTWSARVEFYSNYSRTYVDSESNFNLKLSKYFTATLAMYARFDDSAPRLYSDDFGYWQFKEYMTLGLKYSW